MTYTFFKFYFVSFLHFQEYLISSVNSGVDFSFKFDWTKGYQQVNSSANYTIEP